MLPHVVHVYPLFDGYSHLVDGVTCLCDPELQPVARDDGEESYVVVHNIIH